LLHVLFKIKLIPVPIPELGVSDLASEKLRNEKSSIPYKQPFLHHYHNVWILFNKSQHEP